jgi:hypothetical protein
MNDRRRGSSPTPGRRLIVNCFECALRGETVSAVATCHHCGVGLCPAHLREAQAYRVGGTVYGCPHDLAAPAGRGMSVVAAGSANVRVPAGTLP